MKKISYFLLLNLFLPAATWAAPLIPPIENRTDRISQVGFPDGKWMNINSILAIYWERILNAVFTLLTLAAIIMLIYAGIQYITAGRAIEKTKVARQNITHVVLGIILLVASYFIIDTIVGLAYKAAQNAH